MTGTYIVIEGHDGTGKTTQVALLKDYFTSKGREVVIIEEPGSDDPKKSTPVANYLRSIIKNGTLERAPEINIALFSAARRELWQQKIAPALQRGAVVLASRNYLSTIAYQGYGEGADIAHIREVTALFTNEQYMKPDSTVILTLDDTRERTARIAKRGALKNPDTFESKDDNFQQRVNDAYRAIAHEQQLPVIECIDKNGRRKTIDEVQKELQTLLNGEESKLLTERTHDVPSRSTHPRPNHHVQST